MGHCPDSVETAWDPLSLSLSLSAPPLLSLFLKITKLKKKMPFNLFWKVCDKGTAQRDHLWHTANYCLGKIERVQNEMLNNNSIQTQILDFTGWGGWLLCLVILTNHLVAFIPRVNDPRVFHAICWKQNKPSYLILLWPLFHCSVREECSAKGVHCICQVNWDRGICDQIPYLC